MPTQRVPVIPAITNDVPLNTRKVLLAMKNTIEYLLTRDGLTESQFSASAGVSGGGAVTAHNALPALQGGVTNEYYHLTYSQHTDLTDAGDSALHYHATDRNLANATGLLPWASVDKTGASLSDLGALAHADLTDVSGDGQYHLSLAQVSSLTAGATVPSSLHGHEHSNLSDMQGGGVGEYYHLTSSEYSELTRGVTTTIHLHAASGIPVESISPAAYTTAQHFINLSQSAGRISGGALSDAGGGNLNVAAGEGWIRIADDDVSTLKFMEWPASNGNAIPSGASRYIGVEYNSGNPQVVVKTSDTWDYDTDFPLGTVTNESGVLHAVSNPWWISDATTNIIQRFDGSHGIQRDLATGGLILGNTGTRNVTVSAGQLWNHLNDFTFSAFDSSGAGTFDIYYRAAVSGFTKVSAQTQWPNTQYDDGDGTLANLGANKYGVFWFYAELDGHVVGMYGREEHNTAAAAVTESPPDTLPDRLTLHGILIGRIIFKNGEDTPESVESAFSTVFSSEVPTIHNNLSSIQGGTTGEYYHLTSAQHTDLTDGGDTTLHKHDIYVLADGTRDITGPQKIVVSTDSVNALEIRYTGAGTGNALFIEDATNPDSSPFLVDNSGRVLTGYTTTVTFSGGLSPRAQNHISSGSGLGLMRWSSDTVGTTLHIAKSRSSTVGTRVVRTPPLDDLDVIGNIFFEIDDGVANERGGSISGYVDGVVSAGDTPTQLIFGTRHTGGTGVTTRFKIRANGNVGVISGGKFLFDERLLTDPGVSGNTYLVESSSGVLDAYAGAFKVFSLSSVGAALYGDTTLGTTVLTDTTTVPDQLALQYTTTVLPELYPTLYKNFAASKTLGADITFTRSSTATYFDHTGILRTSAVNTPRFTYSPVSGESLGFLVEGSSTNIITYSEQFNNAAWTKTNSNISTDATVAPDGTTTAEKLYDDATASAQHFIRQTFTGSDNAIFTATYFVKAAERTWCRVSILAKSGVLPGAYFNLSTGTIGTQVSSPVAVSIVELPNGWYRLRVTVNILTGASTPSTRIYLATGDGGLTYSGDNASGLYVWGAQLEEASFESSYIQTTSAAVTRSADVATMTGTNFSDWYNATKGTFAVTWKPSTISATSPVLQADDATASELIAIRGNTTNPELYVVDGGGAPQAQIDAGTLSEDTEHSITGTYSDSDFAASFNGASAVTASSGTLPTVTQLRLGSDGTNYLNGTLAKLAYYPMRLTNTILQGSSS